MATKIVRCGPLLAAGLGAAVSGCTGTDLSIAMGPNGPIPPENVGSISTLGAPPVSATQMASAAPLSPSPAGAVSSEPLPPSYGSYGNQGGYGDQGGVSGSPLAPPSQQPEASQRSGNMRWVEGPQPVGTNNDGGPAPARTEMASLPDPAQQAPVEPQMSEPRAPEPPREERAALGPASDQGPLRPASMRGENAARPARGEVQFLPVVGAPQRDAELLARALSEESQRAGMTIRPASGPVAPIRLKGYFSAFSSGNETVLVYVWDVLDANDQRVHRIQGQETVAGTDGDPWTKIDLETLRKVARDTMGKAAELQVG